jgi:dolichol-phosphate mannosyltransferase
MNKMNKTSQYKLTIVVPVYDEEENMEMLEKRLSSFLKRSDWKSCVLMVNDGSKDNSLDLIKKICNRQEAFYYISFSENSGLSAALKAGIDVTQSDYLGYIDADLQTDPDDFNLLFRYAEKYELVTGVRANRKDTLFKKLQSKIANKIRRMMTHDGATDTGCPLKIIKTEYAQRIPFFSGMHRFLPALIQLQNGLVKEVAVRHYPRKAGLSKYHLWNRLIGPFIDCFAFRWMKKRYINYFIIDQNL